MTEAGETVELKDQVRRDAEAIPCLCKGYAERVSPTEAERVKYNPCGRPGCCVRVFVCFLCGKRLIAEAEAPEVE